MQCRLEQKKRNTWSLVNDRHTIHLSNYEDKKTVSHSFSPHLIQGTWWTLSRICLKTDTVTPGGHAPHSNFTEAYIKTLIKNTPHEGRDNSHTHPHSESKNTPLSVSLGPRLEQNDLLVQQSIAGNCHAVVVVTKLHLVQKVSQTLSAYLIAFFASQYLTSLGEGLALAAVGIKITYK